MVFGAVYKTITALDGRLHSAPPSWPKPGFRWVDGDCGGRGRPIRVPTGAGGKRGEVSELHEGDAVLEEAALRHGMHEGERQCEDLA